MEKWYVVYTKPRAEKKVSALLQQKGFITYLPLQLTIKQWSDRKKKVEVPLFPSYLFIQTDIERFRTDILSSNGVVKFVTIGKDIAMVRDEQIKQIKLLLSGSDAFEVVDSRSIALNQPVEVMAGPFKGFTGTTTEYKGNRYFAITLEALGSNLLINLPANFLKSL